MASSPPSGPQADALSSSGLVWFADYETGDTSQWDGAWITGDASSEITTTMAHSGRYGNALTISNANGSGSTPGVRMTYQGRGLADKTDPKNLPTAAYYSAWYYVPDHVTVTWWNILQWKTGYDDGTGRTARPLYWHDLYNEDDGTLYLELKTRVNDNGQWVEDLATTLATSPMPVPIGQWFHLESYYKWDRNGNGKLTTWLDGIQIWNVSGITTEFDWPFNVYKREWTINNYAHDTTPTTHTIYVDDAAISTSRLGPRWPSSTKPPAWDGTCRGHVPTIVGTSGDDLLVGTARDDVIMALGGHDSIDGRGGDDIICGGGGRDVVRARGGNDRVQGGAGRDVINGGRGSDRLFGGASNDEISGANGNDRCYGGAGTDTARSCEVKRSIP
jgi:hypothetical protein